MNTIINTKDAPMPLGPYSQSVLAGNTLYLSGQIAIDPSTGNLKNATIEEETHQVMKNLKHVLSAAGMHFENVVKSTLFIKNMNDYKVINDVYGSYFNNGSFPSRETVEVCNLPKYVNVEISMIAVK